MLVPNYGRPIPREISYGRAQTIENTLANITYRFNIKFVANDF